MNEKHQRKSITDILQEILANKSAQDANNEFSMLRFENDLVTTFFDNVTKLSDQFTHSFIDELRKDVRLILIYGQYSTRTLPKPSTRVPMSSLFSTLI